MPPPYPPGLAPRPPPPYAPGALSRGDPHLRFAHGGEADFRGKNDTFYAILSAPGIHFAAKTLDTSFLLPDPALEVDGSFFVSCTWLILQQKPRFRQVAIDFDARQVGFVVRDANSGEVLANHTSSWRTWRSRGVSAVLRQATIVVRANGWEVTVVRKPVYNYLSGPSEWRLDMKLRPLAAGEDDEHGSPSTTCFAHGLIGQSFDDDGRAVDGARDDYSAADGVSRVRTRAMAEGAIEGDATQYEVAPGGTRFLYTRFDMPSVAKCPARKIETTRAGTTSVAGASRRL